VGFNILDWLNNFSTIITIWKWSLFQTTFSGYPLRQLLISYDESHTLIVDEERTIGVRKKQYSFKKSNERYVTLNA
jgi:hypothetical protein